MRIVLRHALIVVVLGILTVGLLLPRRYVAELGVVAKQVGLPVDDRLQHSVIGLGLVVALALWRHPRRASLPTMLGMLAAAVTLGAAAELIQPSFGRTAQLADLTYHTIGATIGAMAVVTGSATLRSTPPASAPSPIDRYGPLRRQIDA